MTPSNPKEVAGRQAAEMVLDGMTIGLGTGSTVHYTLVRLAERAAERSTRSDPIVLSTLATAYDAAGHRDRAISAAERALQRATELGATRDAQRIRDQLEHYRANAARSASP